MTQEDDSIQVLDKPRGDADRSGGGPDWSQSIHDLIGPRLSSRVSSFDDLLGTPQIHCKHSRGCVANAFIGGLVNFSFGVGLKTIVALLRSLVTRRLPALRSFLADTFRFAMFLGSFSAGYKSINCLLRKLLHEENKLNAFVAGSVAGWSILWLLPPDRATIAVYLWVRAAQITITAASQEDWFPERLRKMPHIDTGLFTFTACQILYCYIMHPDCLPPSYLKFLLMAGRKDPRVIKCLADVGQRAPLDIPSLQEYAKSINLPWDQVRLTPPPGCSPQTYPLCDIMHPKATCFEHYRGFVLRHFLEYSLRFYVPLNVVSLLLFQRAKLLGSPLKALSHVAISCVRSALFLSLYCGNAWAVQCVLRQWNIYSGFTTWVFGGLLPGLMVLLENKSRRLELALYCMSPTIQSLYVWCLKHKYINRVPHIDAGIFAIAMGIIMMGHQGQNKTLQPTLKRIMKALMGIN